MSASDVLDRPQRVYVWLTGLFVTALLVANLTGPKFFHFGAVGVAGWTLRLEHSVGMFSFPITFLLTDIVNDYFGAKGARRMTLIGMVMAALTAGLLWLARAAPAAPADRTYVPEEMFQQVFGQSSLLFVASLCAYVLGQFCDIFVFGVFKRWSGGRMLWLRATGSTVLSQMVDSLTISFLLGYGSLLASGTGASLGFILETAAKGYALKFLIAIAITPLLYLGHGFVRRVLGLQPLAVEERP
ncbi:MAG: queuosine precursor transporter [Planctomycetes bacterium]|nr:queuosine precursor transporter [Planctomycetota bacterium]